MRDFGICPLVSIRAGINNESYSVKFEDKQIKQIVNQDINEAIRGFDLTSEELSKILSIVYSNLEYYVRDADIEEKLINKYQIGEIIYEGAFTDCTPKIGKITKKVRYFIISNNVADLSEFETESNYGLHSITDNSCYKVLDVFKYNGKTLITLLNIPIVYDEILKKLVMNIDMDLIKKSREKFIESFDQPEVAELDEDWYERLTFPIGMDGEGNLWKK